MKLKFPSFRRTSRSTKSQKIRQQRLRATARRATPTAMDDFDEEEPTTRFSSAFIVVLILHLVFVAGIVTFKSMQANHRLDEIAADPPTPVKTAAVSDSAPALEKVAAPMPASAPIAPLSGGIISQPPQPKIYHAKAGDTLAKVSAAFNVTVADLCQANSWKENWPLHAGQTLTIPAPKSLAKLVVASDIKKPDDSAAKALAAAGATGKTYVVKKGDNPVAIARNLNVSYDDLLKLNKIDDPKKLQIGAVLKVPPAKKKTDPDHT